MPDGHSLLFRHDDRGDKVAVSGQERRVGDLVLPGEQCEVKPQEEIDSLLLEDGIARAVVPR